MGTESNFDQVTQRGEKLEEVLFTEPIARSLQDTEERVRRSGSSIANNLAGMIFFDTATLKANPVDAYTSPEFHAGLTELLKFYNEKIFPQIKKLSDEKYPGQEVSLAIQFVITSKCTDLLARQILYRWINEDCGVSSVDELASADNNSK